VLDSTSFFSPSSSTRIAFAAGLVHRELAAHCTACWLLLLVCVLALSSPNLW
jgi:hypothetical protein